MKTALAAEQVAMFQFADGIYSPDDLSLDDTLFSLKLSAARCENEGAFVVQSKIHSQRAFRWASTRPIRRVSSS